MPIIAPLLLSSLAAPIPVPQLAPSVAPDRESLVGATLPTGERVELRAARVWRAFCVDGHDVRVGDLEAMIAQREAAGERVSVVRRAGRGGGLNVVWNVFGDTSPAAEAALQAVSDFYAATLDDDVTVTINVTFDPGAFGGTGPMVVYADYEDVRQALLADADADDTIQSLLPVGSFPGRREFGGGVSSETEMIMTVSNARALGIDVEGVIDAEMFINDELDFDPSDGIGGPGTFGDYSGVDILIHEVGHALGFVNFIEFDFFESTPLDLYRFPEIGAGDPESDAEFTAFPRALYVGGDTAAEQHQMDLIATETQMSNASFYQASHFRETNFGDPDAPRLGVMEPATTTFETRYPTYVSQADLDAFDAIGWDRTAGCSPADLAPPFGVLDFSDVLAYLSAFGAMEAVADLAEPFGVLNFSDVLAYITLFGDGCP